MYMYLLNCIPQLHRSTEVCLIDIVAVFLLKMQTPEKKTQIIKNLEHFFYKHSMLSNQHLNYPLTPKIWLLIPSSTELLAYMLTKKYE